MDPVLADILKWLALGVGCAAVILLVLEGPQNRDDWRNGDDQN